MYNYMTSRPFSVGWIRVLGQRAKLKDTIVPESLENSQGSK
jgi:hypothetical protein